jgi:methionyl-tRNA formyltransferase
VVFLGTPPAAVPSLVTLLEAGHDVALVVSRPDRRRGRGGDLTPSPVKAAAVELGIPVTDRLNDATAVGAELGVVVAFGRIIRPEMLATLPMLNVHFSLLPRWRGAAPVEAALLAGDAITGVCVMQLDEGLDTGPVFSRCEVEIGDKDVTELTGELASVGAHLLVDVLGHSPLPTPDPQVGDATYAPKLVAATFALDPSRSVRELARVVRLGRSACRLGGRRLRIQRAHALEGRWGEPGGVVLVEGAPALIGPDGVLVLDTVVPDGRRSMSAREFWRGAQEDADTLTWTGGEGPHP